MRGEDITLNGLAIKIIGLRCSNVLISDATTGQLVDALNTYWAHGVNPVSVSFMGSRFFRIRS